MKTDNELIAEFMGIIKLPENTGQLLTPYRYGEMSWEVYTPAQLARYQTSWGWLMPVVEKINMMDPSEFNYHVDRMTHFRVEQSKIQTLSITSPIRIVYLAVVEFIKWYNTNQGVKPQ